MGNQPFGAQSKTLAINVTSTSSTSQALPAQGSTVRFVNEGPNSCYVSIGSGSQTATLPPTSNPTATCTPVLAGTDISLSIPNDAVYNVAAVCRAAQTATLMISVGEGV